MKISVAKIVKALGWRVIATTITACIAYFITHDTSFAIHIGIWDTMLKLIAYIIYDEAFDRIKIKRGANKSEP